jgi:hypothetical protein
MAKFGYIVCILGTKRFHKAGDIESIFRVIFLGKSDSHETREV